jgi:hypothetical protein
VFVKGAKRAGVFLERSEGWFNEVLQPCRGR